METISILIQIMISLLFIASGFGFMLFPIILFLRGNHEEEFVSYIDLMLTVDRLEELNTDFSSYTDTVALYESVKYLFREKELPMAYFDLYGTKGILLEQNHVTLNDLCGWLEMIGKMPYYKKLEVAGRKYVVVHAGHTPTTAKKSFAYKDV